MGLRGGPLQIDFDSIWNLQALSLGIGMAMGRGGVKGWDLRPYPAWIFLASSLLRPA